MLSGLIVGYCFLVGHQRRAKGCRVRWEEIFLPSKAIWKQVILKNRKTLLFQDWLIYFRFTYKLPTMKKAILISFFLLLLNEAHAQSLNYAFVLDTVYTNCQSEGLCIVADSIGNTYVGGVYRGNVDFDPGPGIDTAAYYDTEEGAFLAKYDPAGNFIWCNKMPGTSSGFYSHEIPFMQFNKKGELYFIVQNYSWSSFGAGLFKADTDSGTITYVHGFNGIGWHEGATMNDFFIDDSSNFYFIMSILGAVNIGTGSNISSGSYSYTNILAVKLDSTANVVWAKQFGGTNDDEGVDITADDYGNVYLTGIFRIQMDLDPGPDTVLAIGGNQWVDYKFMVKLNSNGDYINSRVSNFSINNFSKIETTTNNELICVENDKITKLDSSLNYVWSKQFINAYPVNIKLDGYDNISSFGNFSINNDLDPGPAVYSLTPSVSMSHFFISKLNQNGNFISALGFNVPVNSTMQAIHANDQCLVLTGALKDTADFDPYSTVYNLFANRSAYVCKLNKCSVSGPAVFLNGCDSMVVNGQTFFTSGTYSQTLRTTAGCDSTFTLNLTINQSNSSNYSTTICDSLFYHGVYYNTSGLYSVTLVNTHGCDSIVHLNLTVKHSYAISKTATACPNYSFAGNILTTSGIYYDSLQTIAGCDSVIILNLNVVNSFNTTINPSACRTYTSPAGNIYTASGSYIDTLLSVNGCDSIININLALLDPGNHVFQFNQTVYCNIPNLQYQWYTCVGSNLVIIPGATSQSYTGTTGVSYALIVIQNGCKDTSACLTLNTVGINNVEATVGLSVYPNPVSGVINIDLQRDTHTNKVEAYLYTLLGQVIASYPIGQGHNTINTEKLVPGFYFLKIKTGSNTFTKKILIL